MIFNERECNYPLKTFGYWWLSQFRRWGMVKETPDYAGITKKVLRQDIYLDAMKDMGVAPKGKDMQPVKIAEQTFDPNQAEKYALSFPIHSRT
jgi:nitrate/nitrite transport system substrate-binding protein